MEREDKHKKHHKDRDHHHKERRDSKDRDRKRDHKDRDRKDRKDRKRDKDRGDRPDTSHLGIFDINLGMYTLKGTSSKITCHARPKEQDIKDMVTKHGVNYILSIQSDKEKPEEIQKTCESLQIGWKRIDLYGANMRLFGLLDTKKLIIKTVAEMHSLLKDGGITLFVHCAFGLHRTGTMVYSIIRSFENDKEQAMKALKQVREATWENVGQKRIDYAETEILPFVKQIVEKLNEEKEKQKEKPKENLEHITTQVNNTLTDWKKNKEEESSSSEDEIDDFYYTNEEDIDKRENIYVKK